MEVRWFTRFQGSDSMSFSNIEDERVLLPVPGNLLYLEFEGSWLQISFFLYVENWVYEPEGEWSYSSIDMISVYSRYYVGEIYESEFTLGPWENFGDCTVLWGEPE